MDSPGSSIPVDHHLLPFHRDDGIDAELSRGGHLVAVERVQGGPESCGDGEVQRLCAAELPLWWSDVVGGSPEVRGEDWEDVQSLIGDSRRPRVVMLSATRYDTSGTIFGTANGAVDRLGWAM